MHPEEAPVAAAAARLQEVFGAPPPVAVVLGSGLGAVVDRLSDTRSAGYGALALPESGVAGHAGVAHVGTLSGTQMLVLSGRVHLYEGHPPPAVVRYVRALHRWGVQELLLTCSVGGISDAIGLGALVAVRDHISCQWANPLYGPAFGTRFPDLMSAYDEGLRARLHQAAAAAGIELAEGVLAATNGPAYETPAEVRALALVGADIVGMSTVPEVLAAAEVGLRCAVVAVVSNRAAGLSDGPLNHKEVTDAAAEASVRVSDLLAEYARGR